jgi:two-component system, sensor histidine kinase PdtaS
MSAHTECGIPGIREVPYGIHMCQFYETRAELAAALVPYFAAGLRNNERCIWVTAEPLDAAGAAADLRRAGLDVDAALGKGSLVIRDHATWYSESQRLKGNQVLDIWLEEERAALGAGYSGLRITGNTSFLTKEDWPVFMEYEELVDKAFAGRRIVTLCSYLLAQLGASEILDVARRHGRTLERPDESWQLAAARFI